MSRIVEGTVKRLLGGLAAALVWLPVSARSAECPVRAPADLAVAAYAAEDSRRFGRNAGAADAGRETGG